MDKYKASVDATNDALSLKADAELVEKVLENKLDKTEINSLSGELIKIKEIIMNRNDFDTHVKYVKHALEEISKDMALKSNIKDVCKLLDLKANTKYVENVLNTYRDEINGRLKVTTYEDDKSKEGYIIDMLIQENCLGRWVWKSGELKTNYSIPWEVQASNTNPDNFLWEKDKTSVLVVQPGL